MNTVEKAKAHIIDMNERYSAEIANSIKSSHIYRTSVKTKEQPQQKSIELIQTDSVSCLMDCKNNKVCVLNYASYKKPGGMFLQGSTAQEEALCHESTLYPVLKAFDNSYYKDNRRCLNRALYTNAAIYSPDIIFEHNGQTKVASVLTCAAPNWGTAHRYCEVTREENKAVMRDRIKFILDITNVEGIDTLIAGAWGCGVFEQDASEVCTLFWEANNRPANLIFAIPDEYNYEKFEEVCDKFYHTHYI